MYSKDNVLSVCRVTWIKGGISQAMQKLQERVKLQTGCSAVTGSTTDALQVGEQTDNTVIIERIRRCHTPNDRRWQENLKTFCYEGASELKVNMVIR